MLKYRTKEEEKEEEEEEEEEDQHISESPPGEYACMHAYTE
jgi:hypothetical protein